jgi:hypothetical protein
VAFLVKISNIYPIQVANVRILRFLIYDLKYLINVKINRQIEQIILIAHSAVLKNLRGKNLRAKLFGLFVWIGYSIIRYSLFPYFIYLLIFFFEKSSYPLLANPILEYPYIDTLYLIPYIRILNNNIPDQKDMKTSTQIVAGRRTG